MTTPFGRTTVLGYPRIGPQRELKHAVESYWAGRTDATALHATAARLRAGVWRGLRDAGLESIPSSTFSFYDHVLDAAVAVGAVPDRFRRLGLDPLDTYFAMARGTAAEPAMELTKWFDTNYHYLVPEIGPETVFTANPEKLVDEYREAAALGITTRPVLVGPATLLLLAKAAPGAPAGFSPFDRLDDLVEVYGQILATLAAEGVPWVQLDEPAYVADRTPAQLAGLTRAYQRLAGASGRPRIFVASYFGELGDALPALLDTPVEAIGLDLVSGPGNVDLLAAGGPQPERTIVAGLVDGRNIWRTDLPGAAATAATLLGLAGEVVVATSCSLLHVPVDLDSETGLDPAVRERLAFARQKVEEVVALGRALAGGVDQLPPPPAAAPATWRNPGYAPGSTHCGRSRPAARRTSSAPPLSRRGCTCPRCPPPRSAPSRRPPSCARPGPTIAPAGSTPPATSSGCATRSPR